MKSHSYCKSPIIVAVGIFLILPTIAPGAAVSHAAGHGSLIRSASADQSISQTKVIAQGLPFQAPETPEIESPKPVSPTPSIQGDPRSEKFIGGSAPRRDPATTKGTDAEGRAKASEGQKSVKKKRANADGRQSLSTASHSHKTSTGSSPVQTSAPAALPLSTPSPGVSARPPLPPALPYQPPATGRDAIGRTTPLVTGDSTLATIPQSYAPSEPRLKKPQPSGSSLPSAATMGSQEPLNSFVMDSFREVRGGLSPSPDQQQPVGEVPPSSLFKQLSQDIRQLGSGIKQTFSRIIPLGQ